MEIYVTKDGEQLGPFSRQEATAKLKDGTLSYHDLAWHAEDPAWKPLAEVLLIDASAVPTWGEIAASLPQPQRAREKPAPAAAPVVKSGSAGTWISVLALILICGAGLYIYTLEKPKPGEPAAVAAKTPSMALSEIFLEDDAAASAKPKKIIRPPAAAPDIAFVAPEAIPEVNLADGPSPFDEGPTDPDAGNPFAEEPAPAGDTDGPGETAPPSGLASVSPPGDPSPFEETPPAVAPASTTDPTPPAPEPPAAEQTPELTPKELRKKLLREKRGLPPEEPAATPAPPAAPAPLIQRRHSISVNVKATTASSANRNSSSYYSTSRTYSREQNITITVRNLSHDPDTVSLEWYFVGRPAGAGTSRRFIYDQGTKDGVEIGAGSWKEVQADAKELEQQSYNGWYYKYSSGDKPDGWIVIAKADGQVLDIEASSSTLESIAKSPADFKRLLGKSK